MRERIGFEGSHRRRFAGVASLMVLAGLTTVWSGCGRGSSQAAIQAAIEAHLNQQPGLSLANMSTKIHDVKINGDRASAQATFQSKQDADLKVEVSYQLQRQGDHWEVVSSTPMGGAGPNPHSGVGAGGAVPASAAGADSKGTEQSVPASPGAVPPPQPSH